MRKFFARSYPARSLLLATTTAVVAAVAASFAMTSLAIAGPVVRAPKLESGLVFETGDDNQPNARTISTWSPTTGETQSYQLPVPAQNPQFSPRRDRIAFLSHSSGAKLPYRADIYTVRTGDTLGATTQRVYRGGTNEYLTLLDWSPVGNYLLVRSTNRILKVPLDGSTATQLLPGYGDNRQADISPDGSRIAYALFEVGPGGARRPDIFTWGSDGSDVRRLTTGGSSSLPKFTPDGQSIIYAHGQNIAKMDTDGKNSIDILGLRVSADSLTVSPDGNSIAWANPATGIFSAPLSGGGMHQLVPRIKRASVSEIEWAN